MPATSLADAQSDNWTADITLGMSGEWGRLTIAVSRGGKASVYYNDQRLKCVPNMTESGVVLDVSGTVEDTDVSTRMVLSHDGDIDTLRIEHISLSRKHWE